MKYVLLADSIFTDEDNPLLSIICEIFEKYAIQSRYWHIEYSTDPAKTWLRFIHETATLQTQGWKLHISANNASAETVLWKVLPILLTHTAHFKVASSLRQLMMLNKGEGGISQVGKFITIYPENDDDAVQLALKLDKITAGLSGPRIPSDRALHPKSLIHYRYGNFSSRSYIQASTGLIETTLKTLDNKEVSDRRKPYYEAPTWVKDPFVMANIAAHLPSFDRVISERYLIVSTIFASINHSVYLGADLKQGNLCIIKGPGYAWQNNFTDRSMHQQLRHEATMLSQLAPDPHIPALLDVIEQNGNLFLIMEDVEGENLAVHVSQTLHQGSYIPLQQVIVWGIELAEIFETIHTKGFIYADIKSSNVIVGQDGHLYLIDFELTHALDSSTAQSSGRGTRGYMSSQQWHHLPLTISDDIYAFGALLYFLLTGAEPAYAPDCSALLERPLEWLRPGGTAGLKGIITCCLCEEPEARYASMNKIKAALEDVLETIHVSPTSITSECVSPIEGNTAARARYYELSKKLMDTICAQAQPAPDKCGLAWMSTHTLTYGLFSRDINTGNAGILLALAELIAAHTDSSARETLQAAAHWLQHSSPLGKQTLPGLYVGEAGVGTALLRASQVLHDDSLTLAALEKGCRIATLPHTSPDLFNGTAGRLRFHLLLWDETHEQEQLQHALVCGEQLLATAIKSNKQEAFWQISEGDGDLNVSAQPGYAHGVAGIADALLDLYEATGDERFLPLIKGAALWLQQQAIPVMDNESGLSWPREVGGEPHPSYWCHGSTGIGRFFLHCARCNVVSDAGSIAARAAHTVIHTTRWASPTQCHGLAGNCEFLLDMYQTTGDSAYLSDAFLLGGLLETFVQEQHGYTVFSSDSPTTFTPDYMVGYAGIAMCLLRLSSPEHLPHQLSRAGFRVHTSPEKIHARYD